MSRLVLWDVDGTLVRCGDAAREAFDVAIARALGRDVAGHGVRMSGKTDPQIAREILAVAAVTDDEVDVLLPAILEHLAEELSQAVARLQAEGRVLPGVVQVLEALDAAPEVHQSVLTGNVAANAVVKTAAFGLDRYLDLEAGATGSDHHDRLELVPVAIDKALRLRGRVFAPRDVWVVGDTPNDLACARAGGARCLLVGSGRYPADELDGLGADACLPDLSDVERVVSLLRS